MDIAYNDAPVQTRVVMRRPWDPTAQLVHLVGKAETPNCWGVTLCGRAFWLIRTGGSDHETDAFHTCLSCAISGT